MKKMKWIGYGILMLLCCTVTTSCNDEDSIDDIFVDTTWYLGDFYKTTDWKDDNNQKATYTGNNEAMKMIWGSGQDRFFIRFQENTFTAKGTGNTFSGTWSANGKTNEMSIRITKGAPSHGTGLEQEITRMFYDYINNARFYRGNTIWLKFFPDDKKSFMQLTKNRRK